MSSRRLALVCGLVLSSFGVVQAQENEILTQLYGTGVHAFYAGDYKTAHADFSSVIERGTKDPRAYYFRAMAYLKLGRPDEAKADMIEGAKLESADVDGAYNVGRALVRIQGRDRLALEKYRLEARLAAHERNRQADRQKYETVRSREKAVLRDRVNVPLDGGPATVAAPAENNGDITPATAEVPVDQPAKTPAASANPFGDESAVEKPATAPAADDPFGTPVEQPAAAPAGDDPFGNAPAAEAPANDPFGNAAPAAGEPEMKQEDAPAADAPANDDPFGNAPAADAPAAAVPANEDPFGGAAPAADTPAAEAPAGGDPFGNDSPAAGEPEMKQEDAPAADAPANNDPFGNAPAAEAPAADAPANDDPFGTPANTAPAADAPAADKPAENDPFADAPAAAAPATGEKPAEDDPFATDEPAAVDAPAADAPAAVEEKPAEDDPFATDAGDKKPADEKPAAEPAEEDDPFK
jgi:Meckel syndrome type 1 protein